MGEGAGGDRKLSTPPKNRTMWSGSVTPLLWRITTAEVYGERWTI